MAPSPDSGFDLATATHWYGVSPGMPRDEALEILRGAGCEVSEDECDPEWGMVKMAGGSLELLFEYDDDDELLLRQLSLDNERCTWSGRPIIERRLHEVLATMGDAARGASWRPEDAVLDRFGDLGPLGPGPFTDEKLLSECTVWLPSRGLGLVMCEGVVSEVVWRRPEDLPRQYAGSVTESQRQLSSRPDLAEHLRKSYTTAAKETKATPSHPVERALPLLLFFGIAWLSREAWQETQRWHNATIITGNLVSIDKVENKPYARTYRVKFEDPQHRPQFVTLEANDFYVAPSTPGDEAQVAYVAGDPPQVKGVAKVRDVAFVRFLPWYMALAAVYAIVHWIVGIVVRNRTVKPEISTLPVLPTNTGNG